MKKLRILAAALFVSSMVPLKAQTMADDAKVWAADWKYAFSDEGDILFAATWQPGVRFRFWKNLHLFHGPTISTNTIGIHLGVGL